MIKNNIAFTLRIVGGVVAIGGFTWGFIVLFASNFYSWLEAFIVIVLSVCLGGVLWGLSEIINLMDRQTDTQIRMEDKLRKMLPEQDISAQAVLFCDQCGTQVPPGGKTCPTCHHINA